MKVLDVKFYSQVANPDGIPTDWPAQCVEIDDALPVTAGATRMTSTQFASYKAARQAAYDAWNAGTYATALAAAARAALRDAAQNFLLNDPRPEMKALRALALVVLDENNVMREWIESFKAATAAATSLANLQTRVAALSAMPDRTKTQLLNAVVAKITDGSAD